MVKTDIIDTRNQMKQLDPKSVVIGLLSGTIHDVHRR